MHLHLTIKEKDVARFYGWRLVHINSIMLGLLMLVWGVRLFVALIV